MICVRIFDSFIRQFSVALINVSGSVWSNTYLGNEFLSPISNGLKLRLSLLFSAKDERLVLGSAAGTTDLWLNQWLGKLVEMLVGCLIVEWIE